VRNFFGYNGYGQNCDKGCGMTTIWAVVQDGKIVPETETPLQEGARVLVTLVPDIEESDFWQGVDQDSLARVWDNPQDDVYAQLL
jgi:hypothetical protein